MQTFHKVTTIYHKQAAVFRVPTEQRGYVYLRVNRSNHQNDMRAVVEVDAARFLALWRQEHSSHENVARGTPATWPNDYKFHHAEDGFKQGEENPVPLAEVNCFMIEIKRTIWLKQFWFIKKFGGVESINMPVLGFTNGVTRTIWLLTAGAPVFPVECSKREATLLQELAGIPGGSFKTVDELVKTGQ